MWGPGCFKLSQDPALAVAWDRSDDQLLFEEEHLEHPGASRDVVMVGLKIWNQKLPGLTMSHNYFTSSYPHHDIYTFCYWQIFWHSI